MKASESPEWLRCIPLQLVLAAVVVKLSVAHILKLHLSFMKVSVDVAARATVLFCPGLNVAEELYSLVSKCLKVFLL